MYNDEDLNLAVQAGIFTPEAVQAFQQHMSQLRHQPAVDEENFRLVTGFNDIFVVIACVILLSSVAWLGQSVHHVAGAALMTASAWGLSEFFVRQRRMALPAIVLLGSFIGGVIWTTLAALPTVQAWALALAAVLAVLAAGLHWRRFKVPITVAAGAGALIGCLLALISSTVPHSQHWLIPSLIVAGLATFTAAMFWDASDTRRQTRRSDVAFWLHLLAAPLLVHPIFALLGVLDGHTGLLQAGVVLALYSLLALVSLAIDRRALMVSALSYVLYSSSTLLKTYGVLGLEFAITGLCLSSALLMLSAFWHSTRALLVRRLPMSWQQRLPALK